MATMIGQSRTVVLNPKFVAGQGLEQALTTGPKVLTDLVGRDVTFFPEVNGSLPVYAGERLVDSFGYGLDLRQQIHQGRFVFLAGQPPGAPGEIALSSSAAERLGVDVGDRVELEPTRTPVIVTGIAAIATDTLRLFIVTLPLTAARNISNSTAAEPTAIPAQEGATVVWHAAEPLDAAALAAAGWRSKDRAEAFSGTTPNSVLEPSEETAWILGIATLVIAELALIIGVVYAIVVRSNRRELALLASAGAGPKTRRQVITYQGAIAGLVAVCAATLLGLAAAWSLTSWAAAQQNEIWDSLRVDPFALMVLALLGLATPAAAAMVAARGIRFDVVAALTGQPEPVRRDRKRQSNAPIGIATAGGLLLAGGGLTQAAILVMIGALALVIAAGLAAQRILPLTQGRTGNLSLLNRIGWRVTTRAAGRAAALGTLVASLMVLAGLILAGMGGLTKRVEETYVASSPQGSAVIEATKVPRPATVAALRQAFGTDRVVALGVASPPAPPAPTVGSGPLSFWGRYSADNPVEACLTQQDPSSMAPPLSLEDCQAATGFPTQSTPVMVVDQVDVEVLLGRAVTDGERRALEAGQALVLDGRLAPAGVLTVRAPDAQLAATPDQAPAQPAVITKTMPAVVAQVESPYRNLPMVFVTTAGLSQLGAISQPNSAFFYVPATDAGISAAAEDRARNALAADIGAGYFQIEVERGPEATRVLEKTLRISISLLLIVAATLAFITVTLSTQEMRPDLSALAAAGADRRFRTRLSGTHSGQVTLLGSTIGIGVTMLSVPALLLAMRVDWSIWPWLGLSVAAIGGVLSSVLAGRIGGARVTTVLRRAR